MSTDATDVAALLCELIAIPSVNPMGKAISPDRPGSADAAAFVESWLKSRRFDVERQSVPDGQFNVIARLPGKPSGPTIVFDAHTDTVPVDDWKDRAFSPRREGSRIYGRGSCDTKGSLAAMLVAFERVSKSSDRANNIILLGTADEEFGRTGVRTYLAGKPRLDFAVVGEPTRCEPVVACKGAARWDIVVRGKSAHTSNPREGVNAITRIARVLSLLEECERTLLSERRHPLVSGRTLTPALIQGGDAINVVPSICRVSIDLRTLPGENPADAQTLVKVFLKDRSDFPIEHENLQLWHGADAKPDSAFVQTCVEACRARSDRPAAISPRGANYGCHASDYDSNGINAVVIGPGDIAVAHAMDEYVPIEDVERMVDIYAQIMTSPLPAPEK